MEKEKELLREKKLERLKYQLLIQQYAHMKERLHLINQKQAKSFERLFRTEFCFWY